VVEELAALVARFLIPVPVPVFFVFSAVLGGLSVPFLLRVTKDQSESSLDLREGTLGFSLLIGILAFLLWLLVGAIAFSRVPADRQDGADMFWLAVCGVLYGACIFGLCSFVVTFGNLVYRLFRSPPPPPAGPTPEELAAAAERERLRQTEESRRREEELRRKARLEQAVHRRKEARSQCELLFNLHKADITKRFTRKMLDDYMARYMTDAEEADVDTEREIRASFERGNGASRSRERARRGGPARLGTRCFCAE
jgi:hypothetical protein